MYDVRDLIKKAIAIAEKKKRLLLGILENTADPRLRILIQVMINMVEKDIQFYLTVNQEIEGQPLDPIDFGVYDTIASLVNQFGRGLIGRKIKTRQEMVIFSVEIEKSVLALMLDIQGRLAQAEGGGHSTTYVVIGKAIDQKKRTIENLERFKMVD